jgi:hypothetical protein
MEAKIQKLPQVRSVYRIQAGFQKGHQREGDHEGEVQQLTQIRSIYILEASFQGGI